jgi:AraC family transcriptional regulator of arabinose operon
MSLPNHRLGIASRIKQAVEFMTKHLDRPMRVNMLAAQADISPSGFFISFKRLVGTSPMSHFTALRMQHACLLLKSTSMSVKEIASEVGYYDPQYFSRVFKSTNQVAPTAYRAQGGKR